MSRETSQILARCTRCGLVEIPVSTIVVHVARSGAYGVTRCPACGCALWDHLRTDTGEVLVRLGAQRTAGWFSPEVLERRAGPPLSTKDLRRFRREIRRAEDVAGDARRGR